MAKGSAGEVKAQLYVALDTGFLSQEEFDELYALAAETGRLIGGFMRYLATPDIKNTKAESDNNGRVSRSVQDSVQDLEF